MTPQEYKALFDQAYEVCHTDFDVDAYFDPTVSDDEFPELPEVPLDEDVALEMFEAKVTYWEHYGWVEVCSGVLHGLVLEANYEQVQNLASWLMAEAPKGVAELYPNLVKYAAGEFPKAEVDRFQATVGALLERKQRSNEIVANGRGNGSSLQEFIERNLTEVA